VELWIPITLFAAFMQNLRSALQKHLKGRLSTSGATLSRFFYAAPMSWLVVAGLVALGGYEVPGLTPRFVGFMMLGGLTQILATALLVSLFSLRNFAVGTTFSKTETIQTALFGIVVLGETLGAGAVVAIAVSLLGVLLISTSRSAMGLGALLAHLFARSAVVGVASGAMFGISAVSYRAASLALDGGDFVIRACLLLACVTVYQSVVMALYMALREPAQLRAVIVTWPMSAAVSLAGMLGSLGWMLAMTLQNAALVRALGQVELVFTFAASYLFFGERSTSRELVGIALVTLGILLLLLWR
jgi:drug/metabolite transporter (DMT)-like permease